MIQVAGERLTYTQTTPETLADAAVRLLDAEVTWAPIPTNGAQRAAELITRLLPHDHREGVKEVPIASSIICRDSFHTPSDRL
jgi:hypothetical protein